MHTDCFFSKRVGHDSTASGDTDNRGYIDNVHCFRTLMAYENCNCASCPRILYYSNNRTTYEGLPVGLGKRENNIRTMELNTPTARDGLRSIFPESVRSAQRQGARYRYCCLSTSRKLIHADSTIHFSTLSLSFCFYTSLFSFAEKILAKKPP